jgi:predicted DNA-binding transcriptional regulator AlpA
MENQLENFFKEKLSFEEACELTDMSRPTFNRRLKDGLFKKHGSGRKIFFIKSEIIHALINSTL